jgi:hypothetical protein
MHERVVGQARVSMHQGYVDTVRRRDARMSFVVCPDSCEQEAWLAIDAVEQGTHLRIGMTPDGMRELAGLLVRTASDVEAYVRREGGGR